MTNGPLIIELEGDAKRAQMPDVSMAEPVPEPRPEGAAMQAAAQVAARPFSRLSRWFWSLLVATLTAFASLAAWDYATALIARVPVLGWAVTGLLGALALVSLALILRELAGLARLRRIDGMQRAAEAALASGDVAEARAFSRRLMRFYAGREAAAWGRERLTERIDEAVDADAVLQLTEDTLLTPLDAAATREVEAAARQVAAVTALVPLALADMLAALTASLRMVRRISEIYGGRAGVIGGWRLTRAVFAHLVATGAVAVGDDLLEPVLGGSLLTKLSRRFGEGLVNGALTARVGVAAIEVCRPMPFSEGKRPKVRSIVRRALTGLVPGRAPSAPPPATD